jgi:hypothetical protein
MRELRLRWFTRRGNKAGRFLEVSVLAKGGHKGVIWLLEGWFGRGWRRFAGELR